MAAHSYGSTIPVFFFFNDTATTEIYTLSLHDALPISPRRATRRRGDRAAPRTPTPAADGRGCASAGTRAARRGAAPDRKSTRLNSSHGYISYAAFSLKKNKQCNACKVSLNKPLARSSL